MKPAWQTKRSSPAWSLARFGITPRFWSASDTRTRRPSALVRVNGRPWTRFAAEDVDITGLSGSVVVEAEY